MIKTSNNCYHCQAPLTAQIYSDDECHSFCCNGCLLAYTLIKHNKLDSYYQLRNTFANNFSELKPTNDDDLSEFFVNNNDIWQATLLINDLKCAACIWLIESLLTKQPKIITARINASQKTIFMQWRGESSDGQALLMLIQQLGYKISPFNLANINFQAQQEQSRLLKALAVAGFGSGNLMLFSIGLWLTNGEQMGYYTRFLLHLFSALIAIPVAIYSARIFIFSAYNALKKKRSSMDIPISLAIILACIVSYLNALSGQEYVYFDSAVMLIFFLLIGRYLDFMARKKVQDIASDFAHLNANFGRILLDNGDIKITPSHKIKQGSILLVASGEKIAADGVVIAGESAVNNSLLSGETAPLTISSGSNVYAGSINLQAPIQIRVISNSQQSMLATIINLVNNLQTSKGYFVHMADRLAKFYTPIVHLLALITFFLTKFIWQQDWQQALMNATAVLIITCPCALALAVPVAQTIAIASLVKKAIFIKNAAIFDKLNKIDTIVFDKTGTLTRGLATVQQVYCWQNNTWQELIDWHDNKNFCKDLGIISALAQYSKHPIAKGITTAIPSTQHELNNINEEKGYGLSCILNEQSVKIGNAKFCNINNPITQLNAFQLHCFATYQDRCFLFVLQDAIKQDALQVINQLRHFNLILLSGDQEASVKQVAEHLNISNYYHSKNPLEKMAILQQLQHNSILMIGDGLNDAPSLALADAAVSFSSALAIAQNIADVVIDGQRLQPLLDLFAITAKTKKIMQQNLAISLLYNLCAVPFAMLGYVVPLSAAIAMSSSSLLVVFNSFRLRML
jgi:Cu2+-exporting ATPase